MTNSMPVAWVVSFFSVHGFQLMLVSVNLGVSIPWNVSGDRSNHVSNLIQPQFH